MFSPPKGTRKVVRVFQRKKLYNFDISTISNLTSPLDLPDKAGIVFDNSEYVDRGADLKSNSAELVLLLSLGLLLANSSPASLPLDNSSPASLLLAFGLSKDCEPL